MGFGYFAAGVLCVVLGGPLIKYWMQQQEEERKASRQRFEDGYNDDGTPRLGFEDLWWPKADRENAPLMALTDPAQFREARRLQGQKGIDRLRAALKDQLSKG